jgi:hypothetical protein
MRAYRRSLSFPIAFAASAAILVAGCGRKAPEAVSTTTLTTPTSSVTPATGTTPTTGPKSATSSLPATTTPTTRPIIYQTSATLGLVGAWFEGVGFGQVEPPRIFLGGDPTGLLTSINWSSWGAAEATGTGTGWYVAPHEPTAKGSYHSAVVVSFDLGTCDGHAAYEEVEWYFPGEGQVFVRSDAEYACAQGYADSDTQMTLYTPWSQSGKLLGGVEVLRTLSGTGCGGRSSFDVGNQYAWRCSLSNGAFYDPCFAPVEQSRVDQMACADTPWSGVTLINLKKPLARGSWGKPASNLTHPWAMLLGNGDKCGIIEGTGLIEDGLTLNFGCSYGDASYPFVDRQPWRDRYLMGSGTVVSLPVIVAWS